MAINKKLIHFKTFANFNSQKLSANEANTKYTTGVSGTETSGNPDILYQSICFIKDTQQIWTHGCIYSAPSNILNIIEENELVTAGALADLDDRLKVVEEGGGGDYLPLTGGTLTGNLSISQGHLEVFGDISTNSQIHGSWNPNNYYKFHGSENGLVIDDRFDDKAGEIIFNGDGTKVLTDDLSYKTLPTKTSELTNDSGFVSNTNIKTINGTSILGSGDISIPDEVELIEISGDILADEPTYTATEAQAIVDAYNANKLIALHSSTISNYGGGWFIPSIFIRSQQTRKQIYISGVIANFYIEQRFIYDTSSGSVATIYIDRKLDLSEIGSSSTYAYGTCSTAAGTGTKVVELTDSNFTVSVGSIVAVKFTNTNSIASTSLQLKVGDVTAQIKYLNTTFPSNQHWAAGSVVEFIYDGSAWQVLGNIKDNTGSDTKVTQTIVSTPANTTYPVLYSATANKSTTSADAARFSTSFKYNPSTNTLTVGNISSNIPGVADGGANLLGTCSSAADSSEKIINIPGVNLITGSRVWIYFSYGNSCLGNMDCTINHKGTQIAGAKISINGTVGAYVEGANTQYSSYNSGIVFSSGYYEFIVEIINNVCYLRMTNNYIADSSPELHIKTGSTINHNILMMLIPGVHTVFDNPGLTILSVSPYPNRSYSFEFTSGSSAPTLTLPNDVKWVNGTIPAWEANTTYHISIVNNCAVCASFKTVS